MKDALISICIPAYNASTYINEALNSVLNQTYQNWEIIVVEDATMDGTHEIVEETNKRVNQNIVYIRNEKNLGPAVSRNIAASKSKGEWIAFLDSDDIWEKDHLSSLIETSKKFPKHDLIHSGANVFDSQTGDIITKQYLSPETLNSFPISLFDGSYGIMPSQVMISRFLFNKTGGFNSRVGYAAEDLEMWFRCAKANFKFAFTGINTCLYRKHSQALTSNVLKMALGNAKVYDIFSDWKDIPKSIRLKYVSSAWLAVARLARKDNKILAKECISKSMTHQITIKHIGYWVLTRIPII